MKTKKCPECEIELAADTVEGLCPKCLMNQGMASDTMTNPAGIIPSEVEPASTRTISPELGTKLHYFGDYELLEEIARGGMGIVYKARQNSLNRIVALKMIISGQFATEIEVKRFHFEAEAAANLQHPNIVAIHEVGVHEGRHYFTMDFVEGRNLARLTDGKPLSTARAAGYVRTIAETIHFAHQRGTLHRDLKPQNVLIDASDHVRITDFGLARHIQQENNLTISGVAMGSPGYMPPEQARGHRDLIGPSSDVYSIGAILYELLTGQPPFTGNTPVETMMKVLDQEPVSPRKLNDNVSVDLETICLKCLEKRPERRYPTARALAEELDRFLKGELIQARPASVPRKAVNWLRQHRWLATACMAVVILGLLGLVYGLWEQTRYLTWLNAHPGYVRASEEGLKKINSVRLFFLSMYLIIISRFICIFYLKLSRQLPWKKALMGLRMLRYQPWCPIAPGWTWTFMVLAIGGIVCSLSFTAMCIRAFVWESVIGIRIINFNNFYSTCNTFYLITFVILMFSFNLELLLQVIYEQIAAMLGLMPVENATELSPEQSTQIREALFADQSKRAINLYRDFTGAGQSKAKTHILFLSAKLYREHPEKFSAKLNPLFFLVQLPILIFVISGFFLFLTIIIIFWQVGMRSITTTSIAALVVIGLIEAFLIIIYRKLKNSKG